MARFRTGLEIEDRLKTILERIGCTLTEDPDLDHAWKIDFVVTRFPQIPSIFAMGVQVTSRPDDLPKLEEFLRIHQYNRIAEKVMYLEFDKYADLDRGGGYAAFAAMLDYRLNTCWRNTPIIGIRINNDLSITTFNLQERISELRKKQAPHTHHAAGAHRTHHTYQDQAKPVTTTQTTAPVPAAPAQSQSPLPPAPEPAPTASAETATAAAAPEKKPRRRRSRAS
ncbi:MAG TPA: hypothetical protein VNQ79_28075 [Blastocatellia bacterium]|nr:hypothetical protein [Blastocatellia bacterium]